MGTFFHPITLIGPTGRREKLNALVDTDVLFAVIPSPVLERLQVQPHREEKFRKGSETIVRPVTQVEARIGRHRGWAMCVFGDPDEQPRIGRHTLDSFLLQADERRKKLVPKTLRLVQHF